MKKFSANIIRSISEIKLIEKEWDALLCSSAISSPFLTLEWLCSWWECFVVNEELNVITLREQKRLIAVFPLVKRKVGVFTVLEFWGMGRSDYLNFIINRDVDTSEVLSELFCVLEGQNREWDIINLRDMFFSEAIRNVFIKVAREHKMYITIKKDSICPYVPLTGDWEDYLSKKTTKHKKNIKYLLNKLGKNKEATVVRNSEDMSVNGLLEMLLKIESNSWKVDIGNPRILGDNSKEFFLKIIKRFNQKKWLNVWVLLIAGVPVAHIINFVFEGKIFFYNVAYNKAYGKLSPGTYLTALAFQDAFERNLSEYDFLRGDEKYKTYWAKAERQLHHVVVVKRDVKSGLCFLFICKLKWALKRSPLVIKMFNFKNKYFYKFKNMFKERIK
ncbi:MAG: GNAT family N-acetyltransferase [Candidatus Omnitrophota bacterium]